MEHTEAKTSFPRIWSALLSNRIVQHIEQFLGIEKLSPEERIIRRGLNALHRTYADQKAFGLSLQEKFGNLTDAHILTTSLPFREDIPKKYREKVMDYRNRVMEIVWAVAMEIQDLKFRKLDHDILKEGLSKFQERRYIQVRDSQKDLFANYDAIRESINYIHEFNNQLVRKVPELSGGEKRGYLLLNAIIVHELTDSIVEMIEKFNMSGRETLHKINQQVLSELDAQTIRDEELLKRAAENTSDVGRFVEKNVQERRKIRDLLVKRWDELFARIDTSISTAKSYLPTLKLIRDNARERITSLEQMGIMKFVEGSLMNLQEICSVTDIKLAPLSVEEVRELIVIPLNPDETLAA